MKWYAETKIFNNSSVRDIINADGVARMVLKAPVSYDADLLQIEAILDEELPKMMDAIPGLVYSFLINCTFSLRCDIILMRHKGGPPI